MEVLGLTLGVIILVIVIIFYSTLTSSLVLYKFWYWFLLPVFPEMPEITYSAAVGLSLFTVVLKTVYTSDLADEYKDQTVKYHVLIYPWLVLLIGWIAHLIIS